MHKRDMTITFVEVPPTVDGRLLGPLSRDVYSLFRLPARAGDLLTAIAKRAGFTDSMALTPGLGKTGRLTADDWRRLSTSRVVGISTITRTAPPSYELAQLVRAVNPRAAIIFGGPHASALPDEALAHGDVVVLREADHTIVEVLERLRENREQPDYGSVRGVAYRSGDGVVTTPPRSFLTTGELDALPFPVYRKQMMRRLTHQTVITSRGCPFGCEYCSVIQNFGRGYRFLSVDRTMELLRHQLAQTRAPIFFGDDNFTAKRTRVKQLLERCLVEGLALPRWTCQSRVEAAFDDELLDLMVRANNSQVMIGFESINDATLALWNKSSSCEKNTEAIRRFKARGISIHGMFVLGSDADIRETVNHTVDFALRMNLDTAQFFAITPLPGVPLTAKYEEAGRILTRAWHLYDAQHVVVRPARMTPMELQQGVFHAFGRFYNTREGIRRLFVKSRSRFGDSMIRLLGGRLVRRIVKETLPQHRALEGLTEWLARVDEACAGFKGWVKDLYARRAEIQEDIAEQQQKIADTIERRLRALRENLATLADSYHPFCDRLLAELRERLHCEVLPVLQSAEV